MRWDDLIPILVDIIVRIITCGTRQCVPRKDPRSYPSEDK